MKSSAKTSIILEFNRIDDKDEIGDLAMFFIKCKKESQKAGFSNLFNKQDRSIINKFIDNVGLHEGNSD